MPSSESLAPSASPSQISSFQRAQLAWEMRSLLLVPPLPKTSSSTRKHSSPRSTKPTDDPPNATAERGGRPWRVRLHREVAKTVAAHGGFEAEIFRPTIGELVAALEYNPKQFPKKHGKLKDARAADVTFGDGIVWRAVFTLDEEARLVKVLSLGPHDEAYEDAKRRI